jgi:hypothetical protein
MGDEWRLQENVLSRPTQAGPLLEHGQHALWQAKPLIWLGNLGSGENSKPVGQ